MLGIGIFQRFADRQGTDGMLHRINELNSCLMAISRMLTVQEDLRVDGPVILSAIRRYIATAASDLEVSRIFGIDPDGTSHTGDAFKAMATLLENILSAAEIDYVPDDGRAEPFTGF